MGFGASFCRNMAKRSYQYAVRSTYDLFKPDKPKKTRSSGGYSSSTSSKRTKKSSGGSSGKTRGTSTKKKQTLQDSLFAPEEFEIEETYEIKSFNGESLEHITGKRSKVSLYAKETWGENCYIIVDSWLRD